MDKNKLDKKMLSVEIPKSLYDALLKIGDDENRSISSLVRHILDSYVKNRDK